MILKAKNIQAAALVCASLVSAAVLAQSAHAQTADPHAGHGAMQMDAADPHAGHDISAKQEVADPHAGHDMSGSAAPEASMYHGSMQMQGGSAPPDARDPHAYSNGIKLGEGAYMVPGVHRLMLGDEHTFASIRGEQLERRFNDGGNDSSAYSLQGWYGTTYNRFVIKAEGDVEKRRVQESRTELLWSRAIASYWDVQAGVRLDSSREGPDRQWAAFGIQGLAPYWFEVDATAYVGSGGRTALRLEASYELLITQKLILEPKVELQAFGKRDAALRLGSGLAEASAGLRLRYEFTRQFAPYIGVERAGSFGETADFVRAEGGKPVKTRFVAGLRFWF